MLVPKSLSQDLLSKSLRMLYLKQENLGSSVKNFVFNNYNTS